VIFDELKIQDIKRQLAQHVAQGKLDIGVVDALRQGEHFAPIECEVLDFKEQCGEDALSLGKTVRQIVSFYNTYGGYLLYGVAETQSETEFRLVGVPKDSIDVKQLKDKIKNYTGSSIAISLQYFHLPASSEEKKFVALLHVPKRVSPDPLAFGKDGPGDGKNRQIFRADDIYFRAGDECLEAKGKHIAFLNGLRPNPLQAATAVLEEEVRRKVITDQNLPDRNFICPRFVGREAVLEALWSWLADDFSHARVLAGAGGLGKTSIAYEFAKELCVEAAAQFEKIIWVTAKKQQFSGISNNYLDVPETHFETFKELLSTIAAALGYLDSELEGASEKMLKKMVKDGLQTTPAFMVVDDVDSLTPDEQKRVLETGMMLGGTGSRLLMTTRFNQSYSPDIAITIEGLEGDEYREYLAALQDRFKSPPLTARQILHLHETTGGSPLFTESLIRLFKVLDPDKAIKQWRGQHGEQAREAALRREVDLLTGEAKRILLTVAFLQSCSITELLEVTGYSEAQLLGPVDQLKALFLVSAPQITAEGRFGIDANTRALVLGLKQSLVADHARLEQRAAEIRRNASIRKANKQNWVVGAAIRQAAALLRANKPEEAIQTINVALRKQRDNADLLCMKARCIVESASPDHEEARRLCRQAYDGGCRKEQLFDVWYEAEWTVRHYAGAIEAIEAAFAEGVADVQRWTIRKAAATLHLAQAQEASGNDERAIKDYWACAEFLHSAIRGGRQVTGENLRTQMFDVHNSLWRLLKRQLPTLDGCLRALDSVHKMRAMGDYRVVTLLHACEALSWFVRETLSTGDHEGKLGNLLDQKVREVRNDIEQAISKRPSDSRLQDVMAEFNRITLPYERARSS
jgi:hypothetical protein